MSAGHVASRFILFTFLATLAICAGPASAAAAPANDDFSAAAPLSGSLPIVVESDNVGATEQPGEPSHAGSYGGASVWYRWTPSESGRVAIHTCSNLFDSLLAAYTGAALEALVEVASGDDGCGSGLGSRIELTAMAGVPVLIAVDGSGDREGPFTLTVTAQIRPANDDFAAAEVLDGPLPFTVRGDNIAATVEPGEPIHNVFREAHSVWYEWTPQDSGHVTVESCVSPTYFFPKIAVYTGSSVAALTRIQSDAGGCFGSKLTLNAVAGTTYHIAVEGLGDAAGYFSLTIRPGAPVNDNFADAQPLAGELPITAAGTTVDAGDEIDERSHTEPGRPIGEFFESESTVWYRWTPTQSAIVAIDTCDTEFNTFLAVYTGDSLATLTAVDRNDDSCGEQSEVRFLATAGTTYRIAVLGPYFTGKHEGEFRLTIGPPGSSPPNDAFADARLLTGPLPISATGFDTGAGVEPGEPAHVGDVDPGSPRLATVWYSWTAKRSAEMIMSTCDSAAWTRIGVYTGSVVSGLTLVGRGDGSCWRSGEVRFQAVAGRTYKIAAVGVHVLGAFRLKIHLTRPPANDDFADARVLRAAALPITVRRSNEDASHEAGEPPDYAGGGRGASVWYRWTAPKSGDVTIESCGSEQPETLVSVWTGPVVGDLTQAPGQRIDRCGRGVSITLSASAGVTYRIAVDDQGAVGAGEIRLTIRRAAVPANDDFERATTLPPSLPVSLTSTNVGATREFGDPQHDSGTDSQTDTSVWFNWTPRVSGDVVIETCSSSFNTALAAYTGTSVDALRSLVPRYHDPNYACGVSRGWWLANSRLALSVTAGTTYRIAVAGKNNDQGTFKLAIRSARPPANDELPDAEELTGALPLTVLASNLDAAAESGALPGFPDWYAFFVWYRWSPTTSGEVVIETCGRDDVDTVLGVYTGAERSDLVTVAGNDDRCGRQSRVSFLAAAGTTYRIAVGTNCCAVRNEQGPIDLTIRRPHAPANDDFAAARVLRGERTITDTTNDATRQTGERNHGGRAVGSSVWYRLTPSTSGTVTVDTCGSSFETRLAVYLGDELASLRRVAANNAFLANSCGDRSMVSFAGAAGATYSIVVYGEEGPLHRREGEIRLTVTCDDERCR